MAFFPEDGFTPLFRLTLAFAAGLFFSSISLGFFYFVIILILLQIISIYFEKEKSFFYFYLCGGYICASFMGFVIGRIIMGDKSPLNKYYPDEC